MIHTHGIYREIIDRQAYVYVLLINENFVFNFQITSVNFISLTRFSKYHRVWSSLV